LQIKQLQKKTLVIELKQISEDKDEDDYVLSSVEIEYFVLAFGPTHH
jgi:hypothetical protein